MKKELFANPDLCTGCNRCTLACSANKEGVFQPSKARMRVTNFPLRGFSVPNICFQCPKANCLEACPTDAMFRGADGVVRLNRDLCSGCGACVSACPYGMVEQDAKGIPFKCDLCDGDPACAKECHSEALVHVAGDAALFQLKAAQMKTRHNSGTPLEKRHKIAEALKRNSRG
ncbi:4Fe-4S dicluster domain-containing protein [Geomonas azotofigens]|uniref:4Fe-4S dicluster domain-containing protein n=1 Tax=Geomonas azotofigens TaxID=2843196 RepID=UPI001C10F6AD|nr:4Fe-4S dicluster domain-containing protein [Geomonas azotofigens]MBU5614085.1 4Fe-4S dicluster domain-containing protein [Geomonas azotofigens]